MLVMVGLSKKDLFMSKILLTGADGFIGSHLAEVLVTSGYGSCFCFYNSHGGWGWLDLANSIKNNLDVFLGDIHDPVCVREAMRGCDQVFLYPLVRSHMVM